MSTEMAVLRNGENGRRQGWKGNREGSEGGAKQENKKRGQMSEEDSKNTN